MYEQAGIAIEKVAEFEELKAALRRALEPGSVERFLKKLSSKGILVRNFEEVLSKRVLDELDGSFKSGGKTAWGLYDALTLSDKGQMREFYLTAIEQVEMATREKYLKIFGYY